MKIVKKQFNKKLSFLNYISTTKKICLNNNNQVTKLNNSKHCNNIMSGGGIDEKK